MNATGLFYFNYYLSKYSVDSKTSTPAFILFISKQRKQQRGHTSAPFRETRNACLQGHLVFYARRFASAFYPFDVLSRQL